MSLEWSFYTSTLASKAYLKCFVDIAHLPPVCGNMHWRCRLRLISKLVPLFFMLVIDGMEDTRFSMTSTRFKS